jgi:hypothetical protein
MQWQAPSIEWSQTFDRGGDDIAITAVDGSGDGYLFAGQTTSGSGGRDAWVLKTDGNGRKAWQETFGGGAHDWISAATPADGGSLLAGQTASRGNGQLDAWLVKLAADGTEQWQRPYGGTGDDRASSVLSEPGGYVFAGGTKSAGSGGVDAWLMRVDESGDGDWNEVYGGPGDDWVFDHVRTDDGGYLLVGETDSAGSGGRDAWVLATDGDGTAQWNQVYGGSEDDYARAVVPAHDDGYVFAGGTKSAGSGGTDGLIVEIDSTGTETWRKRVGGRNDDRFTSLVRHGEGYLAVGSTASAGRGQQSTWVVKLLADGRVVWQTTYETNAVDYANAVVGGDDPLVVGALEQGGTESARLVKLAGESSTLEPQIDYAPSDPGTGEDVTFDAGGSSAPADATYEWDFDGDDRFETTGRKITKQFDNAGEHNVSLRLRVNGDQRKTTEPVTVVEQLTLTPQSLRPVQVVENTYVSSSSVKTTIDDPDMVADRPTSVLFTVDAENESTLADDDEVSVTVTQTHADGSTTETTGTMLGETIQRITRSDQPSMTAPVERTFQDAPPDRRPPVFELAGDTESISVSLSAADESGPLRIDGTSAPIEAGTDFDIAEMEPLTIGFIAIQAPETTLKEKFEAMGFSLEDIDEDDRDERLPAYGDSDGTISLDDEPDSRTAFESIVEESVDYLRRTYPVPSVEYEVHPDSLKGKTASGFLPDIGTPDGLETDLRTAYDEVSAEFSETSFDEIVAVVPSYYHLYHYRAASGVHLGSSGAYEAAELSQPQAACTVEASSSREHMAAVAAQEIGHHFHGSFAYPDELSMRTRGDSSSSVEIDNSHARTEERDDATGTVYDSTALRSRAFDLSNGIYTLLQESGEFADADSKYAPDHDQWTLGSYMSYTRQQRWADAYIYQQSIDDELSPTPPVEQLGLDSVPILSGNGVVTDDGEIEIGPTTSRQGKPMASSSDGEITLEIKADDGTVIKTQTVADSIEIQGHGGNNDRLEGHFTFAAPFPEETTELAVEHDGTETKTSINPLERTLTGAVRSVPDHGFTDAPADRRQQLLSTVESFYDRMKDGEYDAARERLDSLTANIESWIQPEYETAANEYTRTEILALVEDMAGRTDRISNTNERSSLVPSWGPLVGGAGLGALGGGAALYRYLSKESESDAETDTNTGTDD